MTEALFALGGVFLGALIPALTTLYQARKSSEQADKDRLDASRRALHDRQEARDGRLFDLRRDAYVEFQSQARRLFDWYYAAHHNGAPEPEGEDNDPILAAEAGVQLFGTEAASVAAREAIVAIHNYGNDMHTYLVAEGKIAMFGRVGRTDLGARD